MPVLRKKRVQFPAQVDGDPGMFRKRIARLSGILLEIVERELSELPDVAGVLGMHQLEAAAADEVLGRLAHARVSKHRRCFLGAFVDPRQEGAPLDLGRRREAEQFQRRR